MKPKPWTVEQRFPTKRARDLADEAIDRIPPNATMDHYIETWLQVYRNAGGIEKKP